jgi:hypothetical protein
VFVKKDDTSQRRGSNKDEPDKKFRLTDKQKKYLKIGAAAVVTGLVIYGGYKLSKNGSINGDILRRLNASDSLLSINPLYTSNPLNKNFAGTNKNCGQTTIARELSLRGEKVHAKLNANGMYPEQFGAYFKGVHSKSISALDIGSIGDAKKLSLDDIRNPARGEMVMNKMKEHVLSSFPNGARGSVYVP